MGRSKAWLEFDGRPLLVHVVDRLATVAGPVLVVAAPEQPLPPLPSVATVARDPVEGDGPLRGIAVGLAALAPLVRYAFVCATDAPFVSAAFVRRLHALRCEGPTGSAYEVVAVRQDGRVHPLQAVYATALAAKAVAILEAGERRATALVEGARARLVTPAELLSDVDLQRTDPELWALRSLNDEPAYVRALSDTRRGEPR